GVVDGIRLLRGQLLEPPVGGRRRLLNEGKGADEFRKMPNWDTGDREIFDRAKRMNAPISLCRNLRIAEKVVLSPGRDAVKVNRARHVKRECGSCVASRSLRSRRLAERLDILFCHDGETGFKKGSHKHPSRAEEEIAAGDGRRRKNATVNWSTV